MLPDDGYDEIFTDLDLAEAVLTGRSFEDCTFSNCKLNNANLQHCRFLRCRFENCDLSLSDISFSSFCQSSFFDCRLLGLNWAAASWENCRFGKPLFFKGCLLNHSTFIGLELAGLNLTDCQAHDVDFRQAKLSKANFSGSDLAEAIFHETDLSQADLRSARNYRINPGENNISKARFALPEALGLLYSLDIRLDE